MNRDERHSRHRILAEIGQAGQARIEGAGALVVGGGALGTAICERLARAGIGRLRVVDRDYVTESNLQRQTLFVDQDVTERMPKAAVLADRLRQIHPGVQVEGVVDDVNPESIRPLLAGVDVVLDATDNFETRFLVNDACLEAGLPWVYGGVVGTSGMTLTIRAQGQPCLRCLMRDLPPAGALPTCDTTGILNTLPWAIGAIQVTEALKLLVEPEAAREDLLFLDLWSSTFQRVALKADPSCPACAQRDFAFLRGEGHHAPAKLCGRDTFQIRPPKGRAVDLASLARSLDGHADEIAFNGFLLAFRVERYEITLFPDGRALVRGAADATDARGAYARFIGA